MRRLSALVALALLPVGAAAADPAPDVKGAISRGLAFLAKDNRTWMTTKKCVECHHAPFTIWALNEGKKRGHAVDEKLLAELTALAVAREFPAAAPAKPADPNKIDISEAPLLLALAVENGNAKTNHAGLKKMLAAVVRDQCKDGSWKLSYEFRPIGSTPETLTLLALLALSAPDAPDMGKEGKAAQERGLQYLRTAKPDDETQAAVLRLILWRRLNRPAAETEPLVKKLRGIQNADGGWGQIKNAKSDAYATGQVLYALAEAGMTPGDEAVRKGQAFLAKTQAADGAWAMVSRAIMRDNKPPKNLAPITHAGNAWAVMGLIRSTPDAARAGVTASK